MRILKLAAPVLAICLVAGTGAALAQAVNLPSNIPGATVPVTTVAVGGFYTYAEPYVLTMFGVIFSALLTWALAIFQKRTGVVVSADARAAVNQAAMNAAGRVLASQEANFATMKVDVKSPLIAAELPKIGANVQAAIDHLGMTPDRVAALVAGKIGQLQAQAMSVPVALQAPAMPKAAALSVDKA